MILLLDCYDSFTYNLASLVRKATGQEVVVCHHDSLSSEALLQVLPNVSGVIIGPGPGNPLNPEDYGVIPELWKEHSPVVPVFGVCFGYQSMVSAFGGRLSRLEDPKHGQTSLIKHCETDIFKGIPQLYEVVRYHSLHIDTPAANQLITVLATAADDGVEMAAKICGKPYWGVQFHPESILSTFGERLIANWWEQALEYNSQRVVGAAPKLAVADRLMPIPRLDKSLSSNKMPEITVQETRLSAMTIAGLLKSQGSDIVMLHSAAHPGTWSIIGILEPKTWHIRSKGTRTFEGPLKKAPEVTHNDADVWKVISDFMAPRILPPHPELPFVGGMVGYATYEGSCHQYFPTAAGDGAHSDVSMVFIEKCIVWSPSKTYLVGGARLPANGGPELEPQFEMPSAKLSLPNKDHYTSKVKECDTYLRAGDSYELCYTEEAQIEFNKPVQPWQIYQHLVKKNPAPYCTYMDFDDTLVGTSPERFMSWDSAAQNCQFRPIKGTVSKANGTSIEEATTILKTPKEQGENLMIVDLIRHDLGHLLGGDVTCPQIMQVEEYEHVYQLVSVIEASFKHSKYSGIDVLAETLPPGSMTGAPKLRSVQILRQLENRCRGLYSGVSGYWSLTDVGHWSVIIRSLFRYKDDDIWRAGAGGAVTVLSTPEGEYDEMMVKLQGVIRPFSSDAIQN